MPTLNPVAEALRQMGQGEDFWSVDDLTRDLSPEQACRVPEGFPYSIATQVGHMLFWQDRWLDQIQGQPVRSEYSDADDFPAYDCDQWVDVRARLVGGIELALSIGAGIDVDKEVGGSTAGKLLLKVALHNSYHIGQIALIRQLAGLGLPVING